jgi:hypothetical protein|nr:MAG TPA: hypothetical protein [Caudoviricetes sp.]
MEYVYCNILPVKRKGDFTMSEEANKFYTDEINGMLDKIDRTDVLIYIYKLTKDIFDECYPNQKGGVE